MLRNFWAPSFKQRQSTPAFFSQQPMTEQLLTGYISGSSLIKLALVPGVS